MWVALLAGFLPSAVTALVAYRARALTAGGAAAATLVGTVTLGAGLSWAFILLLFFLSSTALSHLPSGTSRITRVAQKGERRDALQVLANGGIPTLCALLAIFQVGDSAALAFAGGLAAATADTWATEIGSRSRAVPRDILTWRPVPPGLSGGVTLPGFYAALGGAMLIATAAGLVLPLPAGGWAPVALGGFVGAVLDSILGAALQEIRICPVCGAQTEQSIHAPCGAHTHRSRGIPHVTNDVVNLLCCAAGSYLALILPGIG